MERVLTTFRERGVRAVAHGDIFLEDLRAYRPVWREPVRIGYAGYTILSMPPASSGGVTMGEILNIMEGFRPLPPFGSPALMHREAEAMRRAFTDRNTLLGDPAFVNVPVNGLLNLSMLDGWWVEGCLEGVTGWSIADGQDASPLYEKLENVVLPLYYENRTQWIWMMKQAVSKIACYFNSHRMMRRYAAEAYLR